MHELNDDNRRAGQAKGVATKRAKRAKKEAIAMILTDSFAAAMQVALRDLDLEAIDTDPGADEHEAEADAGD